MKILYINDYGTPTGGAEIVTLALRDGMRARGHDARLFASSARSPGVENLADDECFGTLGPWRTLVQSFNPSAYLKLGRLMDEFRPDVVHVKMFLTQLSPSILPLLREVPSLYYAVWYREVCPKGTKMLPDLGICSHRVGTACRTQGCLPMHDWTVLLGQMKLWQRWQGVFDEIIPVSMAVKTALAFEGINSSDPIPNGVPERAARQVMDDRPTAVFAGRLVKEKGADLLLAAMAEILKTIPEARLLIIGDGPERPALQRLAVELNIAASVEFAGHLSSEAIEHRCESAWVQVVCSRWAEPFGMAAIEAMMRGVAVIASDAGGLTEIVEDRKTGLLVQRDNLASLVIALRQLLENRELAFELGRAGHALALTIFGQERFLNRFEAIYEGMIKRGKQMRSLIA